MLLPPEGNVVDVLARDPTSRFTTLVQLIKEAELGDELQKEGPFTVFAPTNEVNEILLILEVFKYLSINIDS